MPEADRHEIWATRASDGQDFMAFTWTRHPDAGVRRAWAVPIIEEFASL